MSVQIEGGQEIELNLAPIIDCFTVLITYLLVTASFLTLVAVEVGVSASPTNAPPQAEPPMPLEPPMVMTVDVLDSGEIAINVTGGNLTKAFDLKVEALPGGKWDKPVFEKNLADIKARWTNLVEVSVSAGPTVIYQSIVDIIGVLKSTYGKVYISGG